MLAFSPEEKSSYLISIDNLISLKLLHDFGVDVSSFPEFMIDVNYGGDTSVDLLRDGMTNLFDTFIEYNPYDFDSDEDSINEEEESLKNTLNEIGFSTFYSEMYFICSSVKVNALFKNQVYKEKVLSLFKRENEFDFKFELCEGDIKINEDTGLIGMSIEFLSELSEMFETIIGFLTFVDIFYQEMMAGENNEVSN